MSLSPVSVLILRPLLRRAGDVGLTVADLASRLGVKSTNVSVALQYMVGSGEVGHNGRRVGRVYYLAEFAPQDLQAAAPPPVHTDARPVACPRGRVEVPDDFEGPLMAEWRRLRQAGCSGQVDACAR